MSSKKPTRRAALTALVAMPLRFAGECLPDRRRDRSISLEPFSLVVLHFPRLAGLHQFVIFAFRKYDFDCA
jgi:hypothetical protein